MSIAELAIKRPVATMLLTLGIALAGLVAFKFLKVAPLPQTDFPVIAVSASLPGASPETMAATVATPLERALGRIAGVNEITSSSSQGSTRVVLQFDLNRDIDGAARDVQAAINAARALLPSSLPSNPTYRKMNPADSPIMVLALTSNTNTRGEMYDLASTIIGQKIAQISGVGQVVIGGSSSPAVRVELNPTALNKYGIALDDVRTALAAANVHRPAGAVENDDKRWQIGANAQAKTAADYVPLIVSYRNGAAVHLTDVAQVSDSVQDVRNAGTFNGTPAVIVVIFRQPGSNIIETVDDIYAALPQLRASLPPTVDLNVAMDRTPTIRASLREVEHTLVISIALVVMVVFVFLRNVSATIIPSIAVPVSLCGTFIAMYFFGYTLDNLSLMALTIATGFVVDDAIVVIENISRHIEKGMSPFRAALLGSREVSFTVVAMSLSLVAVFIPLFFMGDVMGRMLREFAGTLAVAVMISLVVSLTTTPMLCARWLKAHDAETARKQQENRFYRACEHFFARLSRGYEHSLTWALRHEKFILFTLVFVVGLNVYLFAAVPKGFIPQQDTGRLRGMIQAEQTASFQAMREKLVEMIEIVRNDPAVERVSESTEASGGHGVSGSMFITLKPKPGRTESANEVIARLRKKLSGRPGINVYLQAVQDVRVGGRSGGALYQFTLQSDDLDLLRKWVPKIKEAFDNLPQLKDVNSDSQDGGLQTSVIIDRDTAARLGITAQQVDATLSNAFSQRQVSIIYNPLNQYYVIMGYAPEFMQGPEALRDVFLIGADGKQTPLAAIAHIEPSSAPLSVNHQSQFAASTLSFNLSEGVALTQVEPILQREMVRIGVPPNVRGSMQGTAKMFQSSASSQPFLILLALVTLYIVLGVLYESYVHPLTILSTLPSAGVGALLALLLFDMELDIIALIGIFLLIGIVKKNAIMMIDFALVSEREHGMSSRDAIYHACTLRFRPILMTTLAAMLGALPLALGNGDGAELRHPLGVSIFGGLFVSQILTLYTTPVVYLILDRWRLRWLQRWQNFMRALFPAREM
ncbi:MAG: multidrug efflux RND transporter permease subunit [Spongiibacteraceae bacterium]